MKGEIMSQILTCLIFSADKDPGRSCLLAKTSRVAPASLCKIEMNTGIKYPESQCLTFPRYQ